MQTVKRVPIEALPRSITTVAAENKQCQDGVINFVRVEVHSESHPTA
jgi:hypothetical protein